MAGRRIDARVFDGGEVVATLTAPPVRLMPRGYAGVVYDCKDPQQAVPARPLGKSAVGQ